MKYKIFTKKIALWTKFKYQNGLMKKKINCKILIYMMKKAKINYKK